MMSEIDELRAQVAALTAERNEWKAEAMYLRGLSADTVAEQELAAAQSVNAKLREALRKIATEQCGPHETRSIAHDILALPTDTTALDERLAQERERICNVSGLCLSERQREIIRSMK